MTALLVSTYKEITVFIYFFYLFWILPVNSYLKNSIFFLCNPSRKKIPLITTFKLRLLNNLHYCKVLEDITGYISKHL